MKPVLTIFALLLILSPPFILADDKSHEGCENCQCHLNNKDEKASEAEGKFQFSLKDLDGKVHKSAEMKDKIIVLEWTENCLLYTSPRPRDATLSRMPSSA